MLESGQKRKILEMGKNTFQLVQVIAKFRDGEVLLGKGADGIGHSPPSFD
jgi:hypothetical protein